MADLELRSWPSTGIHWRQPSGHMNSKHSISAAGPRASTPNVGRTHAWAELSHQLGRVKPWIARARHFDAVRRFVFAASALFGVTLAVARHSLPESQEVALWSRGIWLLVAGFVLLASRAFWPVWLAIVGANALVFVGLHLNARALNRFILERDAPRLQVALMLPGIVCTALILGRPLPVRTAVVSLLFALQIAPMAALVFGKGWHAKPSLRTVGIRLTMTVVALAVRALHASLVPGEYQDFFQVSVGNELSCFASYLFPQGAGFGFILANLEPHRRNNSAA